MVTGLRSIAKAMESPPEPTVRAPALDPTCESLGVKFLGATLQIKRGQRPLRLMPHKIQSGVRHGDLYAYPKVKSIRRFMDQVRERTRRRTPLTTPELIANLNPVIRGWGNYSKRAHVRKLFSRLNGWIIHRIWSHRCRRWRNLGWKQLPEHTLYGEYGLVNLIRLIPSIASRKSESS
jgi:RNA-directed DNA polymerase